MKNVLTLSLFCLVAVFAYGQEAAEQATPREGMEPEAKIPVEIVEPITDLEPVEPLLTDEEFMIKQVLGQVYFKTGGIPENQWNSMIPTAREYVQTLFKARTMADDEAATQLMAEAQAEFDSAIAAKLTSAQKTKMQQTKKHFEEEAVEIQAAMKVTAESLSRQAVNAREINGSQEIITIEYK